MSALRITRAILISGAFAFSVSGAFAGVLKTCGDVPTYPATPDIEAGVAISASDKNCVVLLPNGVPQTWGNGQTAVVPGTAVNVVAVAAGYSHCVASKQDGSVVCWGASGNGRTTVPTEAVNVTAVAAGERFSAALRSDGTVIGWGAWYNDDAGDYVSVAGAFDSLSDVAGIDAEDNYLIAVKTNGTVVCIGRNPYGQCDVPEGLGDVAGVAAGMTFALALKRDGTVVKWGSLGNFYGTPSGIATIAAGRYHALAVRSNGTMVAWGTMAGNDACVPATTSRVKAIAAGADFSVVLEQACALPVLNAPVASPEGQVCAGTAVTLTQAVTGDSAPYTFQWLKNGAEISGANESTLVVPNPVHNDLYSCRVAPSCDSALIATSPEFTMQVKALPAAPNKTFTRGNGTSLRINIAEIGSDISFHQMGQSQQGARIMFDANDLYYLPAEGNNNSDSFTYTVSNGDCLNTGNITIVPEVTGGQAKHIEFTEGVLTITFFGIPGVEYAVHRSGESGFSTFETVLTTNAPSGGEFIYTESNPSSGAAYYRLAH